MKIIMVFTLFTSLSSFAGEGRYQLHIYQKFPNRSILLDTQTGKMWVDTCSKEDDKGSCVITAWAEADIIGINTRHQDVKDAVKRYESGK